MSIKESTNDDKNIQIHLDDKGRLLIDSDLFLDNKWNDEIQRTTPVEWDHDRCMYHIATLDNIDIQDLTYGNGPKPSEKISDVNIVTNKP